MSLLANKTAVVTGANRGIGRAIVKILAQNGSNVLACARKPDEGFLTFLSGLSAETGVKLNPVYFDLGDPNQVKEGARAINSQCPSIDILVNNAAMIFTAPFQMTPIDKMKEIFEVNYFSQITLTQMVVRKMINHKNGSIIHMSSSAGIEGNEGRLAYAASKAALISSTYVMSKELSVFNIRVNAIAPGLTDTDMMHGSTNEENIKSTLGRTCLKRVGTPEEIAGVVLFLASGLSTYMTGQVLRVDGGM